MATTSIISLVLEYRYAVFFPLALIEGPFIALLAGFLVSSGYLAFIPTFLILIVRDVILDSIYYFIGFFGEKRSFILRFGKRFGITEERENFMLKAWHDHSWKTIFISKLAYGLSAPFLITAGLARMSYVKFITRILIVSVVQYIAFMAVGLYVGDSYPIIASYVHNAELIVGGIILVAFGIYLFVSKRVKRKVLENKEVI